MINKSAILSNKSLSEIELEIERKRKMNEESLQKLNENSLLKRKEQNYEERKKILENYYKEKVNKQKKNISVYDLFDFKKDNSIFDNLAFSHEERIMLKGKEKKEISLKINKNNEIVITGNDTKKPAPSTNEQKNNSIFKFSNLNNKDEKKKEDIFLYGKSKKEEEKDNNSFSLFGDNNKPNLFGDNNKPNLFGDNTKHSLFGDSNKESIPTNKQAKQSLFSNTTKYIYLYNIYCDIINLEVIG